MDSSQRFLLRKLAFSGAGRPTVGLDLVDGLNVVWGASNTGKSFIVKALDFCTGGGSPLPDIEQRRGYDSAWLQIVLPKSGMVTLRRATKGGGIDLYEGAVTLTAKRSPDRTLHADHSTKAENVSAFLLGELGLSSNNRIAKTQTGDKAAFTFRHFVPYVFTEETDMMAEWTPIRISSRSGDTFDKNVLKFLLTGVDDSAVVASPNVLAQKAANKGKIELVEEMIAAAERELSRRFPGEPDLTDQAESLDISMEVHGETLAEAQSALDELRRSRRTAVNELADFRDRSSQALVSITVAIHQHL